MERIFALLRAEDRLLLETSKVDSLTHIVVDTSFYFHDHSCGASYIIQRPKVVRKCPFIKRLPCLIFVLTSHYLRKERKGKKKYSRRQGENLNSTSILLMICVVNPCICVTWTNLLPTLSLSCIPLCYFN